MQVGGPAPARKFPKTIKYLSTVVPVFEKTIPKRYKIYEKYCGNEQRAAEGVEWGAGPKITIIDISKIYDKRALGLFMRSVPDRIFIQEWCVRRYEANTCKYEIGLQYVLLHELIHWARYHNKLAAKVPPKKGRRPGEAGDEFEAEAYGRDMHTVCGFGAAAFDRPCVAH